MKGKEVKEGKEKPGAANGHQFVPVSPSGPTLCVACDKSVSGKELLQCSSKYYTVSTVVVLCPLVAELFRVCVNLFARAVLMFCLVEDIKSVFFLNTVKIDCEKQGMLTAICTLNRAVW